MIPLIKRKRSLVLVLKILDCFPSSIKNKKHIFFDFQMCLNHNFREERSGDTTKFAALCVTLPWCTWYTRDHAKPLFSLVQHSIMPRLKYNTTTTNLGSYAKVFSSFPGHTVKFIMDATRKKQCILDFVRVSNGNWFYEESLCRGDEKVNILLSWFPLAFFIEDLQLSS